MKKHINIPIFIPHVGCPHTCVFCNQRKISGCSDFDFARVSEELETAFATVDGTIPAQIAFFGGSFTGIPKDRMCGLLAIAEEYIRMGKCDSVRISTRPDYISPEILEILKKYHVTSVELGIQSTNDRVLSFCERGHTAENSHQAAALIKEYELEFIGQMMVGLPGATLTDERQTALDIADMKADGARIYPTVVFRDTKLAELLQIGAYMPLTEEEAAFRAANALSVFLERNIPVIRIGLQSSEALTNSDDVLSGGYHPAVGEMAYSLCLRMFLARALEYEQTTGKTAYISVHPSDVSKMIGQKGANRDYFIKKYALAGFRVLPDENIQKNTCKLDLQ